MKDLNIVEAQLTRVLDFFPRVDTKMGSLFALNSVMLTLCALNVEVGDLSKWYIALTGALVLVGLAASFTYLYHCNFPAMKGGKDSLIYFASIQNLTQVKFIDEYEAATEDAYRADMLEQVWRNSLILCAKYKAVAVATRLTVATLIPFATFLVMTAIQHSRIPLVKV